MTIRSEPMKSEAPTKPEPPSKPERKFGGFRESLPWRAIGVVSLAIGLPIWLIGARYTVLGGPGVLMSLASLFHVDLTIQLPAGWALVIMTVVVGAIVSATEFGARPRKATFAKSLTAAAVWIVVWLVANIIDIASTYVGVKQVDTLELSRQIAASNTLTILWTAFVTYCPELFIWYGIRWLLKGRIS